MACRDQKTVEVCLEVLNKDAPHCPHGPTLLFEQVNAGGSVKRFYACSACRDRKSCLFYQLEGEKVSSKKKAIRKQANIDAQPGLKHVNYQERLEKFKQLQASKRKFCATCSLLLLENEWTEHKSHVLNHNVTDTLLVTPTNLLTARENNKTNAQYLFAETTVEWFKQMFEAFSITHVLCIGAPRIHENISRGLNPKFHSMLLDMDHRYGQFYCKEQFCRYNMFNHHFFEMGNKPYKDFLKNATGGKLMVIMDPPFGGLIEVLAHTFKLIAKDYKPAIVDTGSMPMALMFIFPYFNETQVKQHMPYLKMLDYKVNYENHNLFQSGSRMKQGSPVRIFTNLDPKLVVLPSHEGYRYCELCERYVSKENHHCAKCNSCTSKDGRRYIHCDRCGRCVKPSRVHCVKCNMCQLPKHDCQNTKPGACFLCQGFGHKKRDCPYKQQVQMQKKRVKAQTKISSNKRKVPEENSTGKRKQKKYHD